MRPLLHLGATGPDVSELVTQLIAEGFAPPQLSAPTTYFNGDVEQAVEDFQLVHLGPDGKFLRTDGVVGDATWWALDHASGDLQRSYIPAQMPEGLGPQRQKILMTALEEHSKGVFEQPDGSNRGPEIDIYVPAWAHGKPWCCFFDSWVLLQALGHYPLGRQIGGCMEARYAAAQLGLWTPKALAKPMPGDSFVMDRGGLHGHIGFVLRVSEDGQRINTVEGNCGNRVKVGLRELSDPQITGFIDNVRDEGGPFVRGVFAEQVLGGVAVV